jgi:D-glycero-D-manno-heptose 1,7-bisphosphate phosphatase
VQKAVFFDRDGVLNVDYGYVHKPQDFKWMYGAVDAIKYLKQMGFVVVVVTNQSGIARGMYTETDVVHLHHWMNEFLDSQGTKIDHFYYCPHYVHGCIEKYSIECSCRKPEPGMILEAIKDLNIDTSSSFLVGDKHSDLEAAEGAGVNGFLFNAKNLFEFVRGII